MRWDKEAEKRLEKAPVFVRKMARTKVEQGVKAQGRDCVTLADYEEAYNRFRRVFAGKGERASKDVVPTTRNDRPEMVVVDTCSGEVRDCPHLLIPVSEWADQLEKALQEAGISEKLLERVEGDTVLFHHKFKVSISGCPNCCSQPQIKDFGVHGQWKPEYVDGCIQCNACVEACPDGCITLDEYPEVNFNECLSCGDCMKACPLDDCLVAGRKGANILMGGKLGRRPHLAVSVLEYADIEQAKSALVQMAEAYVSQALPEERTADWMMRTGFQPKL